MLDIFNDGRIVLTDGKDIRMVYHMQQEDVEKSYLKLETNILSFVIHGRKWIYHPSGKLDTGPGEGFFLSRGNYLQTARGRGREHVFESLIIELSDAYLAELAMPVSASEGSVRGGEAMAHLRPDLLTDELVSQLLHYFARTAEKKRLEEILPLKMRELLALLISSPDNYGFGEVLRRLPVSQEIPMRVLMETHFRESLSLGQWAFLAGLSLSSFKRKFETVFNTSPKRWIHLRRLEEAHRLLCERNRNVTEVSYDVGFENLAHFVHTFKERYGVTPKQLQLGVIA